MRIVLPRVLLPMLIILALEMVFRAGVWEPLTPKDSHAGSTARVKWALENWPEPIHFVTIGDSRTKHGLDHQLIADRAAKYGFTHAKLTIPGAHILTETLLIQLLESRHPNLQGGIIATSVPALMEPWNGNHELAIAQPISGIFPRINLLTNHFEWGRPSTWGAISSLYQYREDIQDFSENHESRLEELEEEDYSHRQQLFASVPSVPNVCNMDWNSLAACAAYEGAGGHEKYVAGLCADWLKTVAGITNWDRLVQSPLSRRQQAVIELRHGELGSTKWPIPPLVVLMPVSQLWYRERAPTGADEWAHRILDPLVKNGKIQLLDYSHFFDTESASRCDAFTDPFHQSELGMQELTADLLPKLEALLYAPATP